MTHAYVTWKTLHVIGAVLLVGNLIVTAVWKLSADRTKNPCVVAFAQRMVVITDMIFTGGGAALVLVSGFAMLAAVQNAFMKLAWLQWGILLFILVAAVWLCGLIPIQVTQAGLARQFAGGGEIPDRYWKLSRSWIVVVSITILLSLVIMALMILKPA